MSHGLETKLLLGCLAAGGDAETFRRLHGSVRGMDWDYVLSVSLNNGLAPMVYHEFRRLGIADTIRPEIRRSFEKAYYSMGIHNTLYYEELKSLLHLFGQVGIGTIVLKGAAIADAVFKNIALRQMYDIDLLVSKEDIERSVDVLTEAGYVPDEHHGTQEWYRTRHHHLAPYVHPDKGFVVEIHRHIIDAENPFGIDVGPLWKRARHAKIGDVQTLVLSPEDLMTHLCLHMAYFGGFLQGLRNMVDIVQVLRCYGSLMDWEWLRREASEHRYVDFVYYPLCLAKKMFAADIERDVLDAFRTCSKLKAMEVSLLNAITENLLLKDDASSLLPKGYLAIVCRQLLHDAPFSHKVRCVLQRFVCAPDCEVSGSAPPRLSEDDRPYGIQRMTGILLRSARHLAGAVFHKDGLRVILVGLLASLLMSVRM